MYLNFINGTIVFLIIEDANLPPFKGVQKFLPITFHYRNVQVFHPNSLSEIIATGASMLSAPLRVSIFRRTKGSVFELRRLDRQSVKARHSLDIRSTRRLLPHQRSQLWSCAHHCWETFQRARTQSPKLRFDLDTSSATKLISVLIANSKGLVWIFFRSTYSVTTIDRTKGVVRQTWRFRGWSLFLVNDNMFSL